MHLTASYSNYRQQAVAYHCCITISSAATAAAPAAAAAATPTPTPPPPYRVQHYSSRERSKYSHAEIRKPSCGVLPGVHKVHSEDSTRLVALPKVPFGHKYCVPHCVPLGQ